MSNSNEVKRNDFEVFKVFFKKMRDNLPLLTTMIIVYGAMLLLNVCLSYNIDFVDMVKPNVLMIFGGLSLIFIMVISALPVVVILSQHFTARFLVKSLVFRSKLKLIRKYPIIFLLLGCFLLSLWPYLIIINSLRLIALSMIFIAIIIVAYITVLTDYRRKCQTRLKRFVHIFYCLIALFLPMYFGLLSFAMVDMVFRKRLVEMSLFNACMIVSALYYFMIFFTFLMALFYRTHKEFSFYCAVFFICLFLLFSLGFSDEILIKVIGRSGLGFASECYLKSDYEELKIPDVFSRETMSDKIIQLSVVTHLDNIYYLTSNLSPASPAQLRFESEKLKRIGCPPLNNKIISNANGR